MPQTREFRVVSIVGGTQAVQSLFVNVHKCKLRGKNGFPNYRHAFCLSCFSSTYVGRTRGPQAPDERAAAVDRMPALEAAIHADRGTAVVVNLALDTI